MLPIEQCLEELTKVMEEKEKLSHKLAKIISKIISGECNRDDVVVYRRCGCIPTYYTFIKAD